jgi:hypothetical protein
MDFISNEVKELLGLEGEITNKDQFKEAVNKRFVPRATAFEDEEIRSKATGKISAITSRKLAQLFELSEDEIKDKKIEDIIELASTKSKSKYEQLESESKKSTDQAVLDWQSKYEKAKKEANEYKSSVDNFEKVIKQQQEEFVGKEKGWKLNSVFSSAKEKLAAEYHGQVKELELIGFEKKIADNYTFDIGENDEVLIYDKNKNRVQDPTKMGSFITLDTLLKNEANTAGLLKKNEGNGTGTKKTIITTGTGNNGQGSDTDITNKNLSKAARERLLQG